MNFVTYKCVTRDILYNNYLLLNCYSKNVHSIIKKLLIKYVSNSIFVITGWFHFSSIIRKFITSFHLNLVLEIYSSGALPLLTSLTVCLLQLPHCDSTSSPISPNIGDVSNGNSEPPPLPKRNSRMFGNSAINNRSNTFPLPSHPNKVLKTNDVQVDNPIYYPPPPDQNPPPLPPRRCSVPSDDPANSISTQMSYPLVATCATLVNNYVSNRTTHSQNPHNY